MKFSPVLRLCALILLVLTLGWKVAISNGVFNELETKKTDDQRKIAEFLVRQHFIVVFGGRIYSEQPTLLTVADVFWARFRRQLGLRAEATPVLVVIATKGCEAERLPWSELG